MSTKLNKYKERIKKSGERLFDAQCYYGFEKHLVSIDEVENIKMIIQNHTNPLNEGLVDQKAKMLNSEDSEFYHAGNIIKLQDKDGIFISVTDPKVNEVYSEYRIRPINDTISFLNGENLITINGVLASGLLYKDNAYTNQTNVFEDNEMKAIIVPYNKITANFSLFDWVNVNEVGYKVVKIDDETLKKTNKEYGILQLVVFLSPISKLERINIVDNTLTEFKGVMKYARVKDRKLNAVSRELLCEYQIVKTGDYVKYTFDCDDKGTMQEEIYMVFNVPSKYDGYDISLVYRCMNNFKILDRNGNIVTIPYYFEDNRTRIDKTTDTDSFYNLNSSFMIILQDNELTNYKFVNRKLTRIILKGVPYKITGVSNLDDGLLYLGLEIDELNKSHDVDDIANYIEQLNDVKLISDNIYIKGESKIFKGYRWSYQIDGSDGQCHWSVNSTKVIISDMDNLGCILEVVEKYGMGDKIILTAKINDIVINKEIILE